MNRGIIQKVYNRTVRRVLPRKFTNRNGVAVRTQKLFDFTDNEPFHKDHLVKPIRDLARSGGSVVVIGGGHGVSSTVAARRVYPDGHVLTYEAAKEYVDICRETTRLNRVDSVSTVNHAVVGGAIDVWGSIEGADSVSPVDLPPADILVIDAEGAELQILEECPIGELYEYVIVETHSMFGSPPGRVKQLLDGMGVVKEIPTGNGTDVAFVASGVHK